MTHTTTLLSTCAVQDGEQFWSLSECYIRGNTIKYLRIPDEACCTRHTAPHMT